MAREELFRNVIFGNLIKALGAFPLRKNKPDFGAVREAIKRLKENRILVIFPEGRRSKNGRLGRPKLGIGLFSIKAAVPVIPVYLEGTNKALPREAWFIRFKKITAFVGKPLYPDFPDRRGGYELMTNRVMDEIRYLKEKTQNLWR